MDSCRASIRKTGKDLCRLEQQKHPGMYTLQTSLERYLRRNKDLLVSAWSVSLWDD